MPKVTVGLQAIGLGGFHQDVEVSAGFELFDGIGTHLVVGP